MKYIPNEITYHFIFPLNVLNKYNPDELDKTIDELVYIIVEPLLNKIEYSIELILDNKKLYIHLRVNDRKFNLKNIINSLKKHNMLKGLELFKKKYNLDKIDLS